MQKDVLYIDVEDDITAIIGKVKEAKHSIVALVPPKRIGVLQSAVNLRLLVRTAKQADKKLVLITNNDSLMALASSAKIPVAKSLQSKPELVKQIEESDDDDEDIIDGNKLPVGDHAKAASAVGESAAIDKAIDDIEVSGTDPEYTPAAAKPPKKAKSTPKLPNFNNFRKRLVLIIVAAVLLIGFLVWAIFFAPHATITITAKTRTEQYSSQVKLGDQTNPSNATIAAVEQTLDDKKTVDFEATGKRDVGEKATGTVNFSSRDIGDINRTIPAGTELTSSGGKVYVTNSSTTMEVTGSRAEASVGVTASERGTGSNGASGSLSGAPGNVSASLADSTSGGTDKTITVVTKSDVENAKKELKDKDDDEAKEKLKKQFASSVVAIDESFNGDDSKVSSSPAVGSEASDGKATLTSSVTYKMYGIDKNELDTYLSTAFDGMLDSDSQRVYETGSGEVKFSNFVSGKTPSVALQSDGKIGPKIKEDQVKEESKGQVYGEIQSRIGQIDGVDNVDVKFFPFWVSSVPDNVNKITVEFKLADD